MELHVSSGEGLRAFQARLEAMANGEHKPGMHEAVAGAVGDLLRIGFVEQKDPYGTRWAPPAHAYGHPLIHDTSAVFNSLQVTPTSDGVRMVFTDPKAIWHHGGTQRNGVQHIPARPLLPNPSTGLPALWVDVIREEATSYLRKYLLGG